MSKLARLIGGGALVASLVLGSGGAASAHHAGETVSVSKTTGLKDGDTVTVSFTHFTPNAKPVKVVIAGQGELTTIPDKLNFDEYAAAPPVTVKPDGTGSTQFLVYADHGTQQDGSRLDCNTMPCWIVVVQEPFLPQPNYNSVRITFGGAAAPTTAKPAATTAAPSTTAAPAVTVPSTVAPPTTTAVVETTVAPTTEAPTSTTTTTTAVLSSSNASSSGDDDGSNTGLIIGGIVAAVVVLGGGAYAATRRKPPTSTPPPAPLA